MWSLGVLIVDGEMWREDVARGGECGCIWSDIAFERELEENNVGNLVFLLLV